MKRIVLISVIILLGIISFFIFSCNKEGETKAVIYVKYLSDTTKVAPFAHVRLIKYDINVEGVADEKGKFEHVFDHEAILDVQAWLDSTQTSNGMLYGETSIRLEKGKTVTKSVFIH
ncbi:MAG: hypothetical protein N2Z72_08150 [Bacteroidales bacterium]|nr:hypothetical protein [Bacteroidales bacterium]